MDATFRIKEILVQYACITCGEVILKGSNRSILFPKEIYKDCPNAKCSSKWEVVVEEIEVEIKQKEEENAE